MKNKYPVDQMCHDLAAHFLSDVKGATAEDKQELAEAVQEVCEELCREIEGHLK